ncbi:phosphate ABC transporter substrate-binding protein [Runella rosea]|uniref:Phosphate ABC transporter substrate-binding protein n=1 Tax=Runella rosea TaxID=2259595 RepID=A0A344TKI7_9BACT|nr:substrate-binding domain-containing protein [Runella rosea]AXE19158.1 phosphate ABC transporter substrate-binding protein [Runella rosea]
MVDIDFIVDIFSTKMKMFRASFFILSVLWIVSCKRPEDSTSHGRVTITADESLQPMLDQVYQAYEHTFPETHFDVRYLPEHQAAAFMLKDSARLAFVTREFTAEEQKVFKSKGIKYNPQHIATDGVALLINRSNPDTLITLDQISGIFKGTIKRWGQLGSANHAEDIVLVFDNANSSNLNFIMKKFGLSDVKGLNIFSAGSNKKVIEYVKQHPNALGFIGVSWISDGEAPLTAELSQGLRVMGVAEKPNPAKEDYYQPFQDDLKWRRYPLHRKVYVISREMHSGLGSGLVNYIMRDVGSLVIEKCGLWPAKPFNREVILKKEI